MNGTVDRRSLAGFVWSRRVLYRRYAYARIGCLTGADSALDGALADLSRTWPQLLRQESVDAQAWTVVSARVAVCASEAGGDHVLYTLLPPGQADAVLLHYGLGLRLTEAADALGVEAGDVAARLLMAERALPAERDLLERVRAACEAREW